MKLAKLGAFAVAPALCVAAYAFGAYSHAANVWPISQLRSAKRAAGGEPQLVTRLDPFGRLLAFPGKIEAACPQQTERTAVLVVFGGSNAGNYTGQRVAATSPHALNFAGGKCWRAVSPLLGADNTMGEYWTLVADGLLARGAYDDVVIAVATVGDSVSAEWAPGGRLAPLVRETLADLGRNYRPTQVIWDMGEDDYLRGVDPAAFSENYRRIFGAIREAGASAPIWLTVATKCMPDDYAWSPDNPIAKAEKKMPETVPGLRLGVDFDATLKMLDRRDDCHLGSTGSAKIARSWVELLGAAR